MTRLLSLRRSALYAAAAAVGLALAAAVPAQAFTFQDGDGSAAGSRGFKDLDIPKVPKDEAGSRFNYNSGQTTIRQGGTTLQFGTRPSFHEQFNPNNMFNPYYRDGRW
ncbi:MAG: hypothetical protein ACK4UO_09790 [Pseudolabrys sp.]